MTSGIIANGLGISIKNKEDPGQVPENDNVS